MYRLMPFSHRTLMLAAAALLALPVAAAHPLAAQAACVPGETTLAVGDPRLASITPLAADTTDMVIEAGGTTQRAEFSQTVGRARVDGRDAWLFVQVSPSPQGTSLDSVWVDARSWAPLRHVANVPQHNINVRYAGGRVTGTVTDHDSIRTLDQALDPGVFEFSVGPEVLAAVPLCEGVIVHVNGFDPSHGVRENVYHVLGAESVALGGRQRDVWAVETSVGPRKVRLYVERASSRVLGWSTAGPNGATMRGTSRVLAGR